jgi:hypothetical protein
MTEKQHMHIPILSECQQLSKSNNACNGERKEGHLEYSYRKSMHRPLMRTGERELWKKPEPLR